MVNKNKVGNFQFLFGIILLLIAIVGIILSIVLFNGLIKMANNIDIPGDFGLTDEEKATRMQMDLTTIEIRLSILQGVAIASIIFLLISILFITQGLANKADYEKGGKK
jgi:hypothetical protein